MRTLRQEASSKKQTGHALAGNNDPCTCTVESQLSHPTVGIPIGSVISCSRTFYLQKTQQKTSSSCQSTLASPGLALLWNLVVIINYRDCPRVHLAPAIFCIFPRPPALQRAEQSTQHLDGPNTLEAAPSTEGREEGTYRKADLRAARPTTACQELRASIFFSLLGLVCLCCLLDKRTERQISNPNRHSFSASHPLAATWVCPAWTPTQPVSPRRWRVRRTATSTYHFSSNMLLTQSLTRACGPSCGPLWPSQWLTIRVCFAQNR